jgi:predicted 2-oxoglutarate/Fe(II)-dependent dioxygenase YbiX
MVSLRAEKSFMRLFYSTSVVTLGYLFFRPDDLNAIKRRGNFQQKQSTRFHLTKEHKKLLNDGKPVVIDNVLTLEELSRARKMAIDKSVYMIDNQQDDAIRTDRMMWVTDEEKNEDLNLPIHVLRSCAGKIEHLYNNNSNDDSANAKGTNMLKLEIPKICMLSNYKNNEFYKKHLDNSYCPIFESAGNNNIIKQLVNRIHLGWIRIIAPSTNLWWRREITAILYLNEVDFDQGGELRCYYNDVDDNNTIPTYTDIKPRGGRLVIFKSKVVPHEVLPSAASRYALSLWIYK